MTRDKPRGIIVAMKPLFLLPKDFITGLLDFG
jgi:hypothetical protein